MSSKRFGELREEDGKNWKKKTSKNRVVKEGGVPELGRPERKRKRGTLPTEKLVGRKKGNDAEQKKSFKKGR